MCARITSLRKRRREILEAQENTNQSILHQHQQLNTKKRKQSSKNIHELCLERTLDMNMMTESKTKPQSIQQHAKSQTCELKQDAENRILPPKQEEGEEGGGESQSGKETFQYKLKRAVQGRAPASIVQQWPRCDNSTTQTRSPDLQPDNKLGKRTQYASKKAYLKTTSQSSFEITAEMENKK